MNQRNDALTDLLHKQAIQEAIMRYCRGIDRLDMATVRSAYHQDGVDHHEGFDGSIDEFIAWVEPHLEKLAGTRHEISNHLAEIRGDKAVAESYAIARHWGEEPAINFTTGIRYVDYFECRNGVWAIVERFAVREWLRHEPDTEYSRTQSRVGEHGDPGFVENLKKRL